MQEDIRQIIEGCKNNDRKAQERLYKNYYRALLLISMRYSQNEHDAMEVLNSAFLKIFKNIGRYQFEKADIYTWMRTIVINNCLDFIKAGRAEKVTELITDVVAHISPEAITKMKAEEILSLVRQLTPTTRAVFNLYVMEGYDHAEISHLLKISVQTSRWHLHEGRKTLQKMIREKNILSDR